MEYVEYNASFLNIIFHLLHYCRYNAVYDYGLPVLVDTIQLFRPMSYWADTTFGGHCSTGLGYIPVPRGIPQPSGALDGQRGYVYNPTCTYTHRQNNYAGELSSVV